MAPDPDPPEVLVMTALRVVVGAGFVALILFLLGTAMMATWREPRPLDRQDLIGAGSIILLAAIFAMLLVVG